MKTNMVVYYCPICGKELLELKDSAATPQCCGREMETMTVNTSDASEEKHLPVCETEGDCLKVKVGSEPHPMEPKHYIEWIMTDTGDELRIRFLKAGDAPETVFKDCAGENKTVWSCCNVHGLWVTDKECEQK